MSSRLSGFRDSLDARIVLLPRSLVILFRVGLADVIVRELGSDTRTGGKSLRAGRSRTLGRLRVLRISDVELHLDGHRAVVRGESVYLSRKEFLILHHLMDNAGRVVTRRDLLDNAWGPDRVNSRNYLEVHIRRLRTKIESDVNWPTRIRTVRGLGYVFDLPQDDEPPDS